jgi:L-ascorbate metabolism protein UlaG (beta-lactamase superfamily)
MKTRPLAAAFWPLKSKTRAGLLAAALSALAGFSAVHCMSAEAADQAATHSREARMQASPHWQDGVFVNALPRRDNLSLAVIWNVLTGGSHREPESAPPIFDLTADDFSVAPASGLRVTWLGHSSLLLELDGSRLLLDPIWSKRASPFSFAGPARFHRPPLPLAELLKLDIDAVVISHNHYDHLDEDTIRALGRKTGLRFLVPLGVGAHLVDWGIAAARITELDWWEETAVGELRLVATPARHFSGRSITFSDEDETLWAGWAFLGPRHRAFFSGDTAMFPGFAEIGERLGPFDLTMMEVGAYNPNWADVHMGPEQAVEAHRMVRGRILLPVHWGTFNLATHSWIEPIERTLAAADLAQVPVLSPRPGESLEPARVPDRERIAWWPQVPWQTADEVPVRSSGLP